MRGRKCTLDLYLKHKQRIGLITKFFLFSDNEVLHFLLRCVWRPVPVTEKRYPSCNINLQLNPPDLSLVPSTNLLLLRITVDQCYRPVSVPDHDNDLVNQTVGSERKL